MQLKTLLTRTEDSLSKRVARIQDPAIKAKINYLRYEMRQLVELVHE